MFIVFSPCVLGGPLLPIHNCLLCFSMLQAWQKHDATQEGCKRGKEGQNKHTKQEMTKSVKMSSKKRLQTAQRQKNNDS